MCIRQMAKNIGSRSDALVSKTFTIICYLTGAYSAGIRNMNAKVGAKKYDNKESLAASHLRLVSESSKKIVPRQSNSTAPQISTTP